MDLDSTIERLKAGARAARRPCWLEGEKLRLVGSALYRGLSGEDPDTGLQRFFRSTWDVEDLKATDYELVDKRVCFVSGHMDLTQQEFRDHYEPLLHTAYAAGDSFVVGDAPGADAMTQWWLTTHRVRDVDVFHMLVAPRVCIATWFRLWGGFVSDTKRDAAMTEASDYDIAWVRPGHEKKSGTARNLKRRAVKDAKKKENA